MRIQHNIMAMNAYRNYNNNTKALSGNLEKLSSGYKINRAGDDAAGLAISEKMRAQITGLEAAQKNVKDGISLVKTAEGAMQEIQDMLNRMDYLATQSANGTYDNEVDRANLQKEVDALKSEIDRIADSANFNGIKLLDGSQSAGGNAANGADNFITLDNAQGVQVTGVRDATTDVRKAQAGVYSIDLSNFKATATGTGTVSIKVGTATVATVTVSGTVSHTQPTTVTVNDIKAKTGEFTIGGTKFTVSKDGTTLTLRMKQAPVSDFTANMKVTVSGASGVLKASASNGNHGLPEGVTIEKDAIKMDGAKYAQGVFSLTGLQIQDGSQIKIGNEIYTFKIGKDSKVTGNNNVVDLSYLSADTSAGKIAKEGAKVLSQVASGNSWFKVTSDNSTGKVYLTERLDNRPYTNDMAGTTTSSTDADWNGTNGVKMVEFSKEGGTTVYGGGGQSGLTLQIGDTADSFNQMKVQIGDMHVSALGISGVDISTQAGAASAIQTIKDAINTVSSVRGDLGAVQNRLDHTANNLSVMAENIQDAESTIRDTDVADEMMKYVKNNILVQSAQAMLAQANQVPQGVLQLLG